MRDFFRHAGQYFLLMLKVFKRPEKNRIFWRQVLVEVDQLGVQSVWIVAFISLFMGAVLAIQTAAQTDNPLYPGYLIGFATRQSVILEFAPTLISLILAGKIGSRITSEIGTMKVTEQIDALQIMGINPASFLIGPKIVAALFSFPVLITISMFLGVFGGYLSTVFGDVVPPTEYLSGIQMWFLPFDVVYAYIKCLFFAFIITTVSGYHGYTVKGGAVDVGKASTQAVVHSSIVIIVFNLILTQLLLG
jgi:phospholipid/cholesterol/gamma-HCH transport system permease protein